MLDALDDIQRSEENKLRLVVSTHPLDVGLEGLDNLFPVLRGTVGDELPDGPAAVLRVHYLSKDVLTAGGRRESGLRMWMLKSLPLEHLPSKLLLFCLIFDGSNSQQVLPERAMYDGVRDSAFVRVVEATQTGVSPSNNNTK